MLIAQATTRDAAVGLQAVTDIQPVFALPHILPTKAVPLLL